MSFNFSNNLFTQKNEENNIQNQFLNLFNLIQKQNEKISNLENIVDNKLNKNEYLDTLNLKANTTEMIKNIEDLKEKIENKISKDDCNFVIESKIQNLNNEIENIKQNLDKKTDLEFINENNKKLLEKNNELNLPFLNKKIDSLENDLNNLYNNLKTQFKKVNEFLTQLNTKKVDNNQLIKLKNEINIENINTMNNLKDNLNEMIQNFSDKYNNLNINNIKENENSFYNEFNSKFNQLENKFNEIEKNFSENKENIQNLNENFDNFLNLNKNKDDDYTNLLKLFNEEKLNNNKIFTNLNKNISDLYNNLNDFNSKINSEISLKPNIDDINNLLKNTTNINIVNDIQKQIDNINIKLKEFEYKNNQIYSHILSIENTNNNNPNYNYKIIDNNEEINLLKNDLNELKNSLIMKVDINEIKNYLNQKANIDQVNKAISMINKEIDNKLDNEIYLSNIKKQEEINKILCNENITGKWLSINQNFNLSSIKWNLQSINTNPNNFGWVKNLNYITIRDKGVYSIEFIIFILGYNQMIKPNVNLLIDGNPILNFTNLEKNEMDNNLIALKYNEYINIEDSCRIGIGLTSNGINENRGIKAILIIKSI